MFKKTLLYLLMKNIKTLNLSRFVFEGSDYTETANIVFTIEETLAEKQLKG